MLPKPLVVVSIFRFRILFGPTAMPLELEKLIDSKVKIPPSACKVF